MKSIEFTINNYNFKKAMQENIIENIQPLLFSRGFVKSSKNMYVRELDNLTQIISFNITKDRLKAFATYVPIFLPWDDLMNYGIEITGSSGIGLLSGKYFTTMYEENDNDLVLQLQNYNSLHLPNFNKLFFSIREGVLPEMDTTNSLKCFVDNLDTTNTSFFGQKYSNYLRYGIPHLFTIAVYKCLIEQFKEGQVDLENIIDLLNKNLNLSKPEVDIKSYAEKLLMSIEGEVSKVKDNFFICYNTICNERREKYKLLN